ncbi:trafficking protein particle complex subunit 11 [Neocloeon triangulifer]|uniref:trafficking protein particle complex subunit 11 n=1 Tax=Neocloeon triangulifer TaxID=2078957 RepID=UPI00286F7542|nr:trafficking protein particle complex subunit 11 [Neocloeon triangulifer]
MAQAEELHDIPSELSFKPHTFIGLFGLDILNNASHRAIWDAFINIRRHDKVSVHYKLFTPENVLPPTKPKRHSYEWYIPKGILKRNWMSKYLYSIPSVMVIFYDLEWNDPFWNERTLECASRVQSVRAALEGRTTKIAVVLIQNGPTIPTVDEAITTERASSLCAVCELNAKNLFLLPNNEHLQGYSLRLENAFYDLAQTFYHQKVRTIRSHKDHLNKTTHQYLFVRHQFKMGFLNELKQDPAIANKHYAQAYSHLLDIRIVDTNALEIKTAASFINFKLCQIAFSLNTPRDAISHFRKHVEIFKSVVGTADLSFEHYSWLSKQYLIFGEIFNEAIEQGLPAVQTQHPGIYFQQAAQYAVKRREACQNFPETTSYPHPDPLDGQQDLEFYGQRPWRPGKLSAEPLDAFKEKEAVCALQIKESAVNHSMLIISILGKAITQAKTYRCHRTRRQLVVWMAEEYYHTKDFKKALALLSHMLWEYRGEQWSSLLSNALLKALDCVYQSPNVSEYVSLALEAQAPAVALEADLKKFLFQNTIKLLKGDMPVAPDGISINENNAAHWKAAIAANIEIKPLSVEMSNITSFLEVKASFTRESFHTNESLPVKVIIRSKCVHDVPLSKATLIIDSASHSIELEVKPGSKDLAKLTCGLIKEFTCMFCVKEDDVGKEFHIRSINIWMGNSPEESVILRYLAQDNLKSKEIELFGSNSKDIFMFENFPQHIKCNVLGKNAHLEISCSYPTPALLGEWFPVSVELENNEKSIISSLIVKASLSDAAKDDSMHEQASYLCIDPLKETSGHNTSISIEQGTLKENTKCSFSFHFKSLLQGTKGVALSACYTLGTSTKCETNKIINIDVVKPFDVVTNFLAPKLDPATRANTKESFVLMLELRCLSPWPLLIESTKLELAPQITCVDKNIKSLLENETLSTEEVGTEAFHVTIETERDQPLSAGLYSVCWRRQCINSVLASSSIVLPTLSRVDPAPLFVELELPANGWVGSPMAALYRIHNRTDHLLEVEMSLQASDAFMFSGQKQMKLRLMPSVVYTFAYNLYPLLSGLVALPLLKLTPTELSSDIKASQLSDLLERSLPSHIYVMPKAKGKSEISN